MGKNTTELCAAGCSTYSIQGDVKYYSEFEQPQTSYLLHCLTQFLKEKRCLQSLYVCPSAFSISPSQQLLNLLTGFKVNDNISIASVRFHIQCHRIIEWFVLEGTFKDHLTQSPCHGQGHLPSAQLGSKPWPTWPWTLQTMGHPPLLWLSIPPGSL